MSVSGDECVVSSRVEDFDDASSESTVRLRLVQDSPATSDCTRTPPPWIGTNDLEELETPTWELPVQHHHDAHVRGISSQVACRQIQPLANDVAMKHASAGSIQPAWVIRADDHVMGGGHVTGQSTINVSRRSRPTSASSSTSSAGSTLSALRRRRAEFHGAGRFTRYRYPAKFHHQPITSSDASIPPTSLPSSMHVANIVPASLRTTTRYGQEPTVQSSGQRRRISSTTTRRPTTKGRRRPMVDHACQCSLRLPSNEQASQVGSPATRLTSRAVSTGHTSYQDAVVMTTKVDVVSRMTETDLRLCDLPDIDYLANKLTFDVHLADVNSTG